MGDEVAEPRRYVRRFVFGNGGDDELAVQVPELMDRSYGLYTWPSAPVLAQFLYHQRHILAAGTRVLELGAGTALPSIVAARLGAHVTVTDTAASPLLLENVREALRLNAVDATSARVLSLSWGLVSPELLALPPQCLILGADVFYDEALYEPLLWTVVFLLRRCRDGERRASASDEGARFVFSYQDRGADRCLTPLLNKWRLQARQLQLSEFGADGPTLAQSELPGNHCIQLYQVTLQQ